MDEVKIDAELRNWAIRRVGDKVYVSGEIFNDTKKRFPDGTFVTTSYVQLAYLNSNLIQTKNSTYRLIGG